MEVGIDFGFVTREENAAESLYQRLESIDRYLKRNKHEV
jgi:hypothetical protein